jgi:tetratricopeptide (TPR) repeat protein
VPTGQSTEPLARLAEGTRALLEGRPRDALVPLHAAAQEIDGWALPLALLGDASRDAGDRAGAEREWTAASRLQDDEPALYQRLGQVRGQLGDARGAALAYQRLVTLAPGEWRHEFELARALAKLDEPPARAEALTWIDSALARAPAPAPNALYNIKAALLSASDRRDEARAIYRQLIERNPRHVTSWFNLAYTHDVDCQLSEARDSYREVLAIEPANVNAHVALAKIANGSEHATCTKCAESVAADPTLVAPDEVAQHLIEALRADDCRTEWLPMLVVDYAVTAERGAALVLVLEELARARPEVDAGTVRLERALHELRRRME